LPISATTLEMLTMRPARAHHGGQGLLDAEMRARQIGAQHGLPVFGFHAQG